MNRLLDPRGLVLSTLLGLAACGADGGLTRGPANDNNGAPVANPFLAPDGTVREVVLAPGSAVVTPEAVDVIWSGEGCGELPQYKPTDTVYVIVGKFEIDGDHECGLTVAYGGGGLPVGTEISFPDEPLAPNTWTFNGAGEMVPTSYGVQSSLTPKANAWLTVSWDQGNDSRPLIVGVPKVTFVSLPTHNEDVIWVRFRAELVDGRFLDLQVAPNLPPPVLQACPTHPLG
jgi:hypothetical protein